jgi:hypothetical protein
VNDLPSSLSDFVDEVPTSEQTLLVVNRTGAVPLIDLLSKAFANQSVTIAERHIPDGTDDVVCLIEDGQVVATSPFERLQSEFLLVNADRYRTGTRPVGPDQFPDVLAGLTDTELTVAGFPVSDKEKLVFIAISRFIERLALATGDGRLDTTFQRLSRLDDEYGTRTMYGWLGDSGVETHVYGIRDDPDTVTALDVHVHSDDTEAYRRSWVVAFRSGDRRSPIETEAEPTHAALVAIEVGPNVWRGVWTYDSNRVDRIQSYVKQKF